uniref:60S ribosomal protein L27 n=1 Tax=Rhabditophanes sp. KR3021 TaxID=114890 RepID=A0AC35UA51_9BILA
MVKIMKAGKVVLVLRGRFAGRKAVVVKTYDEGSKDKTYGHALVAGVDKYPLKVTKKMGKKKVAARSKVRPFLKVVSYNHVIPTRYSLDAEFNSKLVNKDSVKEPVAKSKAIHALKLDFQEKYKSGKNKWFFTKLRF